MMGFVSGVIFGISMLVAGLKPFSKEWWIVYLGYVAAMLLLTIGKIS